MDYKQKIKILREEISELEKTYKVKYREGSSKSIPGFELRVNPSMKMLDESPWKRLGICIESFIANATRALETKDGSFPINSSYEMTVDESIEMAKGLCIGFFDTWEKELDLLQFKHFTELKEENMYKKNSEESKKELDKEDAKKKMIS